MSNMMPFIMSTSPPPIDDYEEEEDDEFGDFRMADHTNSLTDLNETNDSPEPHKPWAELSVGRKEKELPVTSSEVTNEVCNATTDIVLDCRSAESLEVPENNSKLQVHERHGVSPDGTGSTLQEELPANEVFSNEEPVTEGGIERTEGRSEVVKSEDIPIPGFPKVEDETSAKETRTDKLERNETSVSGGAQIEESGAVCDDFSDFTDFTCVSSWCEPENNSKDGMVTSAQAQDDFDDFDDFESAEFKCCPPREEPTAEETLKMMFGSPEMDTSTAAADSTGLTDSLHQCLDDSSSVWGHLKELETSHALSYQWSNSSANKIFLSSLNIDCRNILFGARWNLSVPRFAANLGVNPLEPVKATEVTSLSQVDSATGSRTATSAVAAEDVVPAAQFDWTTSGLTNPLDGLEKENAASAAEEAPVQALVDSVEVDVMKPIIEDIFGSIGDEVVGKEGEDESTEPSMTSGQDSESKGKQGLSPEAFAIVESFRDLSFLSARKLMHAADENMSRWRLRP